MRILVVDSNLVFARRIKEFLQKNVIDCEADIAQNVHILKRRVANKKYDLILADIIATVDTDLLQETLESINIPKIVWSVLCDKSMSSFEKIFSKPINERELNNFVVSVMGQGCK